LVKGTVLLAQNPRKAVSRRFLRWATSFLADARVLVKGTVLLRKIRQVKGGFAPLAVAS